MSTKSLSLSSKTSLITRRLYRNLLRTSKPFTAPSPDAAVVTCLLHRSGVDDHIKDWNAFVSQDVDSKAISIQDKARDLTRSYDNRNTTDASIPSTQTRNNRTYQRLFRRLLREVVTGTNGYGTMVFPSQVDTTRLRKVIQREFRTNHDNGDTASTNFDDTTRQQVAFTALRELNKKLSYYDWLKQNSPEPIPQQSAWQVSSLPLHPPASYLRPGVFLVSHPYMHDSYFSKSVICILEHKGLGSVLENSRYTKKDSSSDNDDDGVASEEEVEESERITRRSARRTTPPGQTYGVIVNRVSLQNDTGQNRTLREVFREHMLPERMADVFGDTAVREGGPVHVALQTIHSMPSSSEQEDAVSDIGGTIIPSVSDGDESPALYSDRATYFQGNMFKTMSQVENGTMDRDDISFFVGASIWSPGQLAAEIAQGYWIPCRGPPEMALDGICEHEPTISGSSRPLADLWLSMMSACGEDEAKLSHLFHNDHWDENGMPCDAFDDDEVDVVMF